MNFNDPDTLRFLISVFFAVAAVSAVLAVAALRLVVRDAAPRPGPAWSWPAASLGVPPPSPTGHAA